MRSSVSLSTPRPARHLKSSLKVVHPAGSGPEPAVASPGRAACETGGDPLWESSQTNTISGRACVRIAIPEGDIHGSHRHDAPGRAVAVWRPEGRRLVAS